MREERFYDAHFGTVARIDLYDDDDNLITSITPTKLTDEHGFVTHLSAEEALLMYYQDEEEDNALTDFDQPY